MNLEGKPFDWLIFITCLLPPHQRNISLNRLQEQLTTERGYRADAESRVRDLQVADILTFEPSILLHVHKESYQLINVVVEMSYVQLDT